MALIIFFSFPQMPNALDAYMMHGRHSKRHTEVGKRIQLSLTQGKCPFQGISTILVPRLCTKSPKYTVANSLGCVEMFYIWGVSWLETRQLSVKNMQTSWRSQFQQYTILHSLHKLIFMKPTFSVLTVIWSKISMNRKSDSKVWEAIQCPRDLNALLIRRCYYLLS